MVILVDDREYTKDKMVETIGNIGHQYGMVAVEYRLPYGDYSFVGNGPKGAVTIGIERKKIRDLVTCMKDGRFIAKQVPGLVAGYDYSYLLIEGRITLEGGIVHEYVKGGNVAIGMGDYGSVRSGNLLRYDMLLNYLQSVAVFTGVTVLPYFTRSPEESAYQIIALANWWAKLWESHSAHKVIYEPPPKVATINKPGLARRFANQIDGIGWEKSQAVATKFGSVFNMVNAPVSSWVIPGVIGDGMASKIVLELRKKD